MSFVARRFVRLLAPAGRRWGSSSSHSHAHTEHGHSELVARYEAQTARVFGEPALEPGQRRVWGIWEKWHYLMLAGSAGIIYLAQFRPNTNPRDWAQDEAEERLRRREAGLPVEYGVNYAGLRYMKEHGVLSGEVAEALEAGALPQAYYPRTPAAAQREREMA